MNPFVLIYLCVGVITGLLAGLFGIGGGVVVVPMVVFALTRQGVAHEHIMHLAIGTSMASIVFTAASSFRAHHNRGAVHWGVVRRIAPGILLGTFLGSFVAARMSTDFLKGFFAVFLYCVAAQFLVDRPPKASRELPGLGGMFAAGNIVGAVSSLVGIGGGTMSVPFMIWCNMSVHDAIGTSAAIGFPIAVAGTLGYIYNGLHVSGLPQYSFGYIYLPMLICIVGASVLTAPLGARLAHSLPVRKLKRIFAALLLIMATKMIVGLL